MTIALAGEAGASVSIMSTFSPWDFPMPNASRHSNLQCFLKCITPTVPTRLLPIKKCIQTSNGLLQTPEAEKDTVEGFTLSDLWQSYTEWSAYGAGVPIVLNNGDRIVQYYSPSLSALQIYTRKPFSSSGSLFNQIDEKFNKSSCNSSCLGSNATRDDDSTAFQSGSSAQTTDQRGCLYYQYNEMASPYDRVPLKEKIRELGKHHPGLVNLRSRDLSPYSWMAIAWYPVYQVPEARNVKELSACFLTYHPLSSLSQGSKNIKLEKEKVEGKSCPGEDRISGSGRKEEISLPPFAVVTYKMFGTLWINPKTSDHDRIICQRTAACYWLKQLQFHHHDFNFFMSRQFQNY